MNLHLWVFQKAETALADCSSCNFSKLTCANKFQIELETIILCTLSIKFASSVELFDSSRVIRKSRMCVLSQIFLVATQRQPGLLLAYWQSSLPKDEIGTKVSDVTETTVVWKKTTFHLLYFITSEIWALRNLSEIGETPRSVPNSPNLVL